MSKSVIILPTYNEVENLEPFVGEILANFKTHVLIVDDNSPDGTGKLADKLAAGNPAISVEHRAGKKGLGSAYVHGFKWALARDFDTIIEMDSDFSHNPKDLQRLVEGLEGKSREENADLVLGSRYVEGGGILNWPPHRLFISALGNYYARAILWLGVKDLTGGFKVFRRKVLETINLDKIWSDGYAFQIETTTRAIQKGFKVKELPIIFKDRTRGQSKISRKVVFEAVWLVWKLRLGR